MKRNIIKIKEIIKQHIKNKEKTRLIEIIKEKLI